MSKSDKPVQLALDREVWERQPRETDSAWQAFINYRDNQPRSIRKTAVRLDKGDTIVGLWSRRWRWVERVVAWDNHLNALYLNERMKAQKEMAHRHIKLAEAIQTKVATKLLNLTPEQMTAGDTARLLDVAVKIERLALGAPTDHTKTEVEGQVSIKHEYSVAARIFSNEKARQLYLALMAQLYMVEPEPSGFRDVVPLGEVEII